MVWGWLIAMVFIQCVAMSMAELCSSMPTSGGLYYAAAVLAPPGWGPLAAWVTGWSNWLGQVTGAPSVDYALSAMILAAASINDPNYVPTRYQTFLLTALIMLIHGCISSMPTRWIANFNSWGSSLNIIALFIVIVMIPAGTNRADQGLPKFSPSSQVWGNIYNGTDFPAGVAILMTFVAVIWTMSGESRITTQIKDQAAHDDRLRRPFSPERGMLKCQHCFPTSHCPHIRSRRPLRLVSPTGGRIHSCRHPFGYLLRPRATMGCISPASAATENGLGDTRTHHHVRLLHGPRLHGCRIPSHLCLCSRWLLPRFAYHQAGEQAHADAG